MLSLTKKALEEFDNQHDFERMCAEILSAFGYKNVVPIAPKGGPDEGKDITFTTESGGKGLACVTLNQDSDSKFIKDFSQRKKGEFEKYYFFTNQYLTAPQKKRYILYCLNSLDAELIPQDIEALRGLLDGTFKSFRKRFLHIDDNKSDEIRKQITKFLKYPATLSTTNFKDRMNLVEWRLARPLHREIYYYISDIDDDELKEVPGIGKTLHTYKECYYNFCLSSNDLVDRCKKIIGTHFKDHFVFIIGWSIYFDYFLMRSFGHTAQYTKQNISLNVGITYEDCELVFSELLNTREIAREIERINIQWIEINFIISQLEGEINRANSQ